MSPRVLPAIEAIVARLGAGPVQPREMEQASRALAALTRTLRELNTLLKQYPAPPEDEAEKLNDFRRELARRIAAIIAARPPVTPAQEAHQGS